MGGALPTRAAGERYRIVSEIGRGAMGVVYRAVDRERGEEVALKMLRNVEPSTVFRFKQEFRALTDVVHPNLVPLYELFSAGDAWFLAMELVEGVDLLRHVRGAEELADRSDSATEHDTPPTVTTATGRLVSPERPTSGTRSGGRSRRAAPLTSPGQLERLRAALSQLVAGVEALHRGRRLHRDIKPSNVLVTGTGRVVLLDFGIVTTFAEQSSPVATARLLGTPAYMAPEQTRGQLLTEASDWYAVGVMLYEALAGCRPFEGDVQDVLSLKREIDPLPPSSVGASPPPELEALCMDLLSRDRGAARTGARCAVVSACGRRTISRRPSLPTNRTRSCSDARGSSRCSASIWPRCAEAGR